MEWAFRTRNSGCRRKNLRVDVEPPIKIVLHGQDGAFPGQLHDVSLGGARISSDCFPAGVEHLKVTCEETEDIAADVKWSSGNLVGVAFEQSAPAAALLTQCLRRLVPYARAWS